MEEGADPTIDLPKSPEGRSSAESIATPRQFGAFTIRRRIGRGGMGVVYEAEQKHPQRLVALKLIRAGYANSDLLRRFEYESQMLARLQHVGIAQIFQSGTLKDQHGRSLPYFAMELVDGKQLVEHARERDLSMAARLELLARICDAVSHAHQKGVIHRDLKPANILVDAHGQPKVLDFGVARLSADDVEQATMQTDAGQIVGTVQYMSPEQTSGDRSDIDTRTDIYSLGVIAYELLGGAVPYDVRHGSLPDAIRTIREHDPPPLGSVHPESRGDVETMVAKAMEKEKDRRYQTADAFSADIRRFLNDEPIAARPASAFYHLRKLARRHRGLTIGLVASLIALTAGVAATSYALARALKAESRVVAELRTTEAARESEAREREKADAARAIAETERGLAVLERERALAAEAESARYAAEIEQVADFQASLLRRAKPHKAGPLLSSDVLASAAAALAAVEPDEARRTEALRQFEDVWTRLNATDLARSFIDRSVLKPAIRAIDRRFSDQPLVAARLRQAIADRYRDLGLLETALPLYQAALAARRAALGPTHPQTRIAMRGVADLLDGLGRKSEAVELYREILAARPPSRASAVARLLVAEGNVEEAEPHLRDAIERMRRNGENGPTNIEILLDRLASIVDSRGRAVEAESLRREALAAARSRMRATNPDLIPYLTKHGAALAALGRFDEAEGSLTEGLDLSRRLRGEEHIDTTTATLELGALRYAQGRHSETVALLLAAESAARITLSERPTSNLGAYLLILGNAEAALGTFDRAELRLLEAHQLFSGDSTVPVDSVDDCTTALADCYAAWNAAAPDPRREREAAAWRARTIAAVVDD